MSRSRVLQHSDLPFAAELARQAGALLLEYRRRGFEVESKSPDDFVTVADREASNLIVRRLREYAPEDGVLSEEMADDAERLGRSRVWLVDPIDGTKQFVQGSPDYAVSIGLAVNGEPVLGVVYAPALGGLYAGESGRGVFLNGEAVGLSTRPLADAVIAVSSTEHARELLDVPLRGVQPSGSVALKLAKIAAGEADATFTINPRSEWDVCAGHALVRAAGGVYAFRDGAPVRYNSPDPTLTRGTIGGREDVVDWLSRELDRLAVPEQYLFVRAGDAAYEVLPPDLRDHPNVHVRMAGGALESLVVVERAAGGGWRVARREGRAEGVEFILRNLRRSQPTLEG